MLLAAALVALRLADELAPDLARRLDDQAQLRLLLAEREVVAVHGRREAALRREAELVDVGELARLLDAALERVLALQLAALGRHEPEHDELAGRQEAQRLEAARALVVPLHEEAVDLQLVEQHLGDVVVAAARRTRRSGSCRGTCAS